MKEEFHNDLTQKYSKLTIAIHWATALLIIILFPLGKYMADLEPSEKMGLMKVHVILGLVVLVLTAIRSWQFFKAPRPANLKTGSNFNDKLAAWVHHAFYFLLIGLAISGMVTMVVGGYADALKTGSAELIQTRNDILPLKGHGMLALIMMLLLATHVIGIIKHYFLLKENTLKRMS